jgi:hypothetical protein
MKVRTCKCIIGRVLPEADILRGFVYEYGEKD